MLQIQRKAQLTGHNAAVFALAPAQEPRYFFSAAGDGWVVRWDMEEPDLGKLVAKVDNQLFALLYLPEGGKVIAGNMNGGLHWIDIDQPDRTCNIAHHKKGVYAIIRAGDSVLTAGGEGLLTRWSAEEGRSLESIQLSKMSLRGLDYSPLRNEIAAGASDHQIYVLDATTLAVKKTIPGAHANSVFSVRYSPDGRYLLSGGRDAFLRIWERKTGLACRNNRPIGTPLTISLFILPDNISPLPAATRPSRYGMPQPTNCSKCWTRSATAATSTLLTLCFGLTITAN